jgi:hypothetical protein
MTRIRSMRPFRRASTRAAIVAAVVVAALALAAPRARAQLIDRILAVVAGRPITLSDVTAATRLGLVAGAARGRPPTAGRSQCPD